MTRSRIWAALILIWLPLAVTVCTWAAWSARLPDRLPTHWSGTGPADGFSDATGFAVAMIAVGVAAGVAGLVIPRTRYLLAACGAVAGGAAGAWLAAASVDPVDTRLGWRFLWLVAGIGWAAVVAVVAGPQPGGHTPPPPTVAPMNLSPTERAAWSTTQRAPLLLTVSVIAALAIAVVAAAGPVEIWPVVAVPVITGLVFGRIRVTVDRRGVRLVAGFLDIPFKSVALTDIVRATAADINPIEWGGWGYRITPGRSALVLRKGPGLVVHLADGHLLAITVDDPNTPAALLGALLVND